MKTRLNLMSPANRQALKTAYIMNSVQSLMFVVAFIALLAVGVIVSLELMLRGTVKDASSETTSSFSEYDTLTGQLRDINEFVARTDEMYDRHTDWSSVLDTISGITPEGIRLESIQIFNGGDVSIEGTAEQRDDVLAMRKKLEALPQFTDVSSPLSNILQQKNLRFEFTMKYVP